MQNFTTSTSRLNSACTSGTGWNCTPPSKKDVFWGFLGVHTAYSAIRSFFDLLVCWLFESQEWGTGPDQAYHGAQQHCREVQPEVLPSDLDPFCGPSIWQEQHHSIGLRPQMPTTKKDTPRYPKSNVLWRWTIQKQWDWEIKVWQTEMQTGWNECLK